MEDKVIVKVNEDNDLKVKNTIQKNAKKDDEKEKLTTESTQEESELQYFTE